MEERDFRCILDSQFSRLVRRSRCFGEVGAIGVAFPQILSQGARQYYLESERRETVGIAVSGNSSERATVLARTGEDLLKVVCVQCRDGVSINVFMNQLQISEWKGPPKGKTFFLTGTSGEFRINDHCGIWQLNPHLDGKLIQIPLIGPHKMSDLFQGMIDGVAGLFCGRESHSKDLICDFTQDYGVKAESILGLVLMLRMEIFASDFYPTS